LKNVDLGNSNARISLHAFPQDGSVMDLTIVEIIQMRRTVPIQVNKGKGFKNQ
jgi:hypothetical protein